MGMTTPTHMKHYEHLQKCLKMVQDTKDIKARSTLYKIYSNCNDAYIAMDREMVECRRLSKVTHKYTELTEKFEVCVNEFEQWYLMATLMY